MEATINVRIDQSLKSRGDKALLQNNISISQAVRLLYEYMANTREIPEFMKSNTEKEKVKQEKIDALQAFAGKKTTPYSHMTDEQLKDIYMSQYN